MTLALIIKTSCTETSGWFLFGCQSKGSCLERLTGGRVSQAPAYPGCSVSSLAASRPLQRGQPSTYLCKASAYFPSPTPWQNGVHSCPSFPGNSQAATGPSGSTPGDLKLNLVQRSEFNILSTVIIFVCQLPVTHLHDITSSLPIPGRSLSYLTPAPILDLLRSMSSKGLDCSGLSLAWPLWLSLFHHILPGCSHLPCPKSVPVL